MDLIQHSIPDNVEGLSFASVFKSADAEPARDAVFSIFQGSDSRSIRTDLYKFIRNFSPRRLIDVPVDMTDPPTPRIKQPGGATLRSGKRPE